MNIILRRHMGYYVLQVYIPCFMLVTLSWVAFFINREATSDRSCIGIMCVLSLATLSFDVRNEIPNVPYVTALDWFLIMCYLFLFASLLEFTAVHYFTKVGYGDMHAHGYHHNDLKLEHIEQKDVDYVESQMSTRSNLAYKNDNQGSRNSFKNKSFQMHLINFWKCVINDPKYKTEMTKRAHFKGINSVSKCDKVSRILFPFCFLLLNIIYWRAYYKPVIH
jgi:gamma-aminobutyric acid receptor subunit alpha